MTTVATSDDALKYPVGRFAIPDGFDPTALATARADIAALPVTLRAAIRTLDDRQLDTPYRDGGWTIRQTIHHFADSHANAVLRFRFALTEDAPEIKPYSETEWARLPDARTAPVEGSVMLIDGLHERWVALMDSMTPAQWQRTFLHPEHKRAFALWQVAGIYGWHSRHHVAHITRLRDRMGWS